MSIKLEEFSLITEDLTKKDHSFKQAFTFCMKFMNCCCFTCLEIYIKFIKNNQGIG